METAGQSQKNNLARTRKRGSRIQVAGFPTGRTVLMKYSLDYIVGTRTNGANAFQIFEAMADFNPDVLASRLRALNYNDFLRTAYWFAVSHVCKARAGSRCQVCNSRNKLTAHHRTYDSHGAEHLNMNDITSLCENCHGLFHGHLDQSPKPSPTPTPIIVVEKVRTRQPNEGRPKLDKEAYEAKRLARNQRRVAINPLVQEVVEHTESDIGLPPGDEFILTIHLINACRCNGAFTSATMQALGLLSPPVSGWATRLLGKKLSREGYRSALEGRFIYRHRLPRRAANQGEFDESKFIP